MKTHYDTLGIGKSASLDEIKLAYRRLIRQHHPDMGAYDAQQAWAINQAYETLKDPKKRQAYDEMIQQSQLGEQFWSFFDKAHRTVRQTIKDTLKDALNDNASILKNLKPHNHHDHIVQWVYPWQAIFGDKVVIHTRFHHLMVAVPAFEKSLTMTIQGAGKPKGDGTYGNLVIKFKIKVPNASSLSHKQQQAFRQFFD